MTSQRIYGRKLWLTIDGTDKAADIKECMLEPDDTPADDLTFGDAAAGVSSGKLSITAIQSTDPDSFWRYCWANAGEELPFRMAAHGNDVPSAAQPHVAGTVTVGARPAIGGKADPRASYEFKVERTAKIDADLITAP